MHSLHSIPQHVRLSMLMFPSAKNSFTPAAAKSSSLCCFFAFFPLSDSKLNMSTLLELSWGICSHLSTNCGLKRYNDHEL